MALLKPKEKDSLRRATDLLLAKMDNGNALLIGEDPQPPRLVILGEEMTYQEALALGAVAPRYPVDRKEYLDTAWESVLRVVRSAKGSARHRAQQEIKRQGSSWRLREIPLDHIPEPGRDGLEGSILAPESVAAALDSPGGRAADLGWREDRVRNTLSVAKYVIDNGPTSCWIGDAAAALGMDRHTVGAR